MTDRIFKLEGFSINRWENAANNEADYERKCTVLDILKKQGIESFKLIEENNNLIFWK